MEIVINSYGTTLHKENDMFVVESVEGKQKIPTSHVKTISISSAARISSDAILLAIKNNIDVLFVNGLGKPEGRVWSVQYGSISTIRKSQLEFSYSNKTTAWVKELLQKKINNQQALLLAFQPINSEEENYKIIKKSYQSLEHFKGNISKVDSDQLSEVAPSLRGWEGAAAKSYFSTISKILPEQYRYESRDRRPAFDVFNAMLNYAYGMLYGKVEGALIKAGIDPYIGIFHRDDFNRPALVFDVIEKYRMWMDYVVISLCNQEAIHEDCYTINPYKGCLLEPIGKRILIQSVNDYLYEIINLNGLDRSRLSHMDLDAQRLAKFFVEQEKK